MYPNLIFYPLSLRRGIHVLRIYSETFCFLDFAVAIDPLQVVRIEPYRYNLSFRFPFGEFRLSGWTQLNGGERGVEVLNASS